jgi:hypothetical protein
MSLPGPFGKAGVVGLLNFYHSPCARIAWQGSQGRFFTTSICRKAHWLLGFHPHSHFPTSCALVSRASLLICRFCSCSLFCALTFDLMAHEGSPMLEEVVAARVTNPMEVVRWEERVESSSTNQSSNTRHGSAASSQDDGSTTKDASEASRSYQFGPSTMTGSRIQELISFRFFTEGVAQAPREEVILEPTDDKAIVFKEFFVTRLCMPPQPALVEILLKFWVQLHQLTPNAIVQLSKFFSVVKSVRGTPTSDGFMKRYEIHY